MTSDEFGILTNRYFWLSSRQYDLTIPEVYGLLYQDPRGNRKKWEYLGRWCREAWRIFDPSWRVLSISQDPTIQAFGNHLGGVIGLHAADLDLIEDLVLKGSDPNLLLGSTMRLLRFERMDIIYRLAGDLDFPKF